jgi:hypothetical protein
VLCKSFSIWCSPTYLLLLPVLLMLYPRNHHQVQGSSDFFEEFYGFSSYIQAFNSFLANFYVWCKIGSIFISFSFFNFEVELRPLCFSERSVVYQLSNSQAFFVSTSFWIWSHFYTQAQLDHDPPVYTSHLAGWQACTTAPSILLRWGSNLLLVWADLEL